MLVLGKVISFENQQFTSPNWESYFSQKNIGNRDPIVWSISALPCPWEISRNTLPFQQKNSPWLELILITLIIVHDYFILILLREKTSERQQLSVFWGIHKKTPWMPSLGEKKHRLESIFFSTNKDRFSKKTSNPSLILEDPFFLGGVQIFPTFVCFVVLCFRLVFFSVCFWCGRYLSMLQQSLLLTSQLRYRNYCKSWDKLTNYQLCTA